MTKSLQQLPDTRLHPKFRILAMQEREIPRQDPGSLPFKRRVEEETLHMERRIPFVLIDVHLHGEQTVARTKTLLRGRIATPNNDLFNPQQPKETKINILVTQIYRTSNKQPADKIK